MRMRDLLAAVGAFALSATPVLAQADQPARGGAPVEAQNEMFGGSSLLTIAVVIAIGLGLFFLLDDDDDSDSP